MIKKKSAPFNGFWLSGAFECITWSSLCRWRSPSCREIIDFYLHFKCRSEQSRAHIVLQTHHCCPFIHFISNKASCSRTLICTLHLLSFDCSTFTFILLHFVLDIISQWGLKFPSMIILPRLLWRAQMCFFTHFFWLMALHQRHQQQQRAEIKIDVKLDWRDHDSSQLDWFNVEGMIQCLQQAEGCELMKPAAARDAVWDMRSRTRWTLIPTSLWARFWLGTERLFCVIHSFDVETLTRHTDTELSSLFDSCRDGNLWTGTQL